MEDLTGQKFGAILVTSFSHKEERRGSLFYYWNCIDGDGYKNTIEKRAIKSGAAKSCRKKGNRKSGNQNKKWRGYGEISLTHFSQIRNSAKSRKLEFNISIKQMWDRFLDQDRKCALTGQELSFPSAYTRRDGTASLDRIDSNQGYIPHNIQWVHKQINISKQKMSDTEFITLCGVVVNNIKNLKDKTFIRNNNKVVSYISEAEIFNSPVLRNMYGQLCLED